MYLLENIGMQSSQDSSQLVVIGWVNDLNAKLGLAYASWCWLPKLLGNRNNHVHWNLNFSLIIHVHLTLILW